MNCHPKRPNEIDIWALDVAQTMGVATGAPNARPTLYTVHLAKLGDEIERKMGRAVEWAIGALRESIPSAVYIETAVGPGGMWGKTNAKTLEVLNGYTAVFRGLFNYRGIPVHSVSVSTVRKFILGNGRMRGELAKPEIMLIARREGLDPQNYDESDAWALWRFVASLYGGPGAPSDVKLTARIRCHLPSRERAKARY